MPRRGLRAGGPPRLSRLRRSCYPRRRRSPRRRRRSSPARKAAGLDAPGIVADQTAEPQAGYREELGEGPRDPEPSVDHICDADLWDEVGEGLIDNENGAGLIYAGRNLEYIAAVEQSP